MFGRYGKKLGVWIIETVIRNYRIRLLGLFWKIVLGFLSCDKEICWVVGFELMGDKIGC